MIVIIDWYDNPIITTSTPGSSRTINPTKSTNRSTPTSTPNSTLCRGFLCWTFGCSFKCSFIRTITRSTPEMESFVESFSSSLVSEISQLPLFSNYSDSDSDWFLISFYFKSFYIFVINIEDYWKNHMTCTRDIPSGYYFCYQKEIERQKNRNQTNAQSVKLQKRIASFYRASITYVVWNALKWMRFLIVRFVDRL